VGLLHALHTLKREQRSPEDLAEEACYIEIDQLGGSIGKQDQYATAFGGIVCLEIDREGGVRVAPVQVPEDALQELESNVALFYTGIQRSASQVLSSQSQATSDGDPQVVEALHVIKDIGTEIKLALEKGDLVRFGWLLDEHWRVKKSLSDGVSSGQIDGWYAIGKANGAIGGKVMGAGGGGFLMFYCQNGCRSRLRQAMAAEGLKELRFAVDFEGTKVLVNF
jgi:D-glycero-alpha-D-manno-heptose-7-phosphate kinase